MIRIIGVGSPLGDDAAGLEAARRLADAPPDGCEIVGADRPGLGLIDLFEDADAVIVIDAVQSGRPPGTLHDLSLATLARIAVPPTSSHAFGPVAAVQLARQLGRGFRRGRLLGIAIAPVALDPSGGITAAVEAGIDRAVRRSRRWVRHLTEMAPDQRARRSRQRWWNSSGPVPNTSGWSRRPATGVADAPPASPASRRAGGRGPRRTL